jgi:hypothetical protein
MPGLQRLLLLALAVFTLNIPFGYWRAGTRRFSVPWILSIHLPVPMVIAMRLLSGIGWQLASFPALLAAFFSGQFLGGRLRASRARRS